MFGKVAIRSRQTAPLQHYKQKKPRWQLSHIGKLTMKLELPLTGTAMMDQSLGRLNQLLVRFADKPGQAESHLLISDLHTLLINDMYVRRFCRDGAVSIFAYQLRKIVLEMAKLATRQPKLLCQPLLEIFRFVIDQQVEFDWREAECIVTALLTYYLNHQGQSANGNTLFAHINTIIYLVLSKADHVIDCTLMPVFMEVYTSIRGLDCSEAAVPLLFLTSGCANSDEEGDYSVARANSQVFHGLPWTSTIFPELCKNVTESIKHLTSEGRYQTGEGDEFITKLLPKSLELLDNMGFVFASKLFQEAYWLFNLEGVFRLLVRLEVVEVENAIEYVQLMTSNDYFPHTAVKLLEEFTKVPEAFEETLTSQLEELGEYLEMLEEVDCRDCRQLAHFFEKLFVKSEGFIGQVVDRIYDLKWDLLIVVAALLEREDHKEIQLYLMKNGLIAFLLEQLLKQSIALPFLAPAYRTLGLFLRGNPVGLSYIQWVRSKLERFRSQEQESIVDLASKRLFDSHPLIIGVLANFMVCMNRNQGNEDATTTDLMEEFGGRLSSWFMLASTARALTTDQSTIRSLMLLRLMLLIAADSDDERDSILTNIVLYAAVEQQSQEQNPSDSMEQLMVDLRQWRQHHDTLCDRRLVESASGLHYSKLRKACCWLLDNLELASS